LKTSADSDYEIESLNVFKASNQENPFLKHTKSPIKLSF